MLYWDTSANDVKTNGTRWTYKSEYGSINDKGRIKNIRIGA
jgi:hypothetical protein